MSLKACGDSSSTSHLLFSYEAAQRTDVMSIMDLHFRPTTIPGFDHDSSTILVAVLPGDAFLQVTPAEVRVIPVDSLTPITWRSPGRALMLAACNPYRPLAICTLEYWLPAAYSILHIWALHHFTKIQQRAFITELICTIYSVVAIHHALLHMLMN